MPQVWTGTDHFHTTSILANFNVEWTSSNVLSKVHHVNCVRPFLSDPVIHGNCSISKILRGNVRLARSFNGNIQMETDIQLVGRIFYEQFECVLSS